MELKNWISHPGSTHLQVFCVSSPTSSSEDSQFLGLHCFPSALRLLLYRYSVAWICLLLHLGKRFPWLHFCPLSPGFHLSPPNFWLPVDSILPQLHWSPSVFGLRPSGSTLVSRWPASTTVFQSCGCASSLHSMFCYKTEYIWVCI